MKFIKFSLCLYKVHAAIALTAAVMASNIFSREVETNRKEQTDPKWILVWEDDFETDGMIDSTVWSKIPRSHVPWCIHMSDYDELYDVKDGNLILRGMVNPGLPGDTMPFLTGGIFTKDKKSFYRGKIEIRAKLGMAKGAWPAFWLLSFDNTYRPHMAEIDIMEYFNHNYDQVSQAIHCYYNLDLGQSEPKKFVDPPIHKGEYNVYGVELWADSVVLRVNGHRTLCYPRIETDLEWQFPFDRPFLLLLDMQLGGLEDDYRIGKPDPNDLPVEMQIDWVRFYEYSR